jgi:rod shape-determining protein MreD
MSLTLAAVGAVVAALFDTSVAPFLQIGGGQLDLVIVLAVIWTVVVGFEGGLTWAFVGGMLTDLLAPRPLGSTAFVALIIVGLAAIYARVVVRGRYVRPIVAVFGLTLLFGVMYTFLDRALRSPFPIDDAIASWVPGAVLDTIAACLLAPVIVRVHARLTDRERIDW